MKTIISVDGSKGGTGKSVISCSIVDYTLPLGKSVLLIDGDTANPDVHKTYNNTDGVSVESITVDSKEGFIALASTIHKSSADCVIINNPARSEAWRTHGGFITNNLDKLNSRMLTLWVANRQQDCIELLIDYHEALPAVPIVFVINSYFGGDDKFELWNGSNIRKEIINNGGGEIVYPDVADRVMHVMRTKRMKWSDIESLDFGELIEAERVRNAFYKAFAPLFLLTLYKFFVGAEMPPRRLSL